MWLHDRLDPRSVMRGCAVLAAAGLGLLAVASPDLFDRVVRGGEPMEPLSRERLDFLRLVLAPLGLATLAFCLAHRNATTFRPLLQLVFVVPLAGIAVVGLYKLGFGAADKRYLMFVREDGPVEYATAIVFLLGTLAAARVVSLARDWQTRAFFGLFAGAMLFIALSEISFGQRLIGVETPEALRQVNLQEEITLHNLPGVQFVVYGIMPLLIMGYAIFSGPVARWLAVAPVGRHVSRELLAVAPMPWYAISWFVPMTVFCVKALLPDVDDVFKDQEPSELAMAVGFLMLAIHAWVLLAQSEGRFLGQARRA